MPLPVSRTSIACPWRGSGGHRHPPPNGRRFDRVANQVVEGLAQLAGIDQRLARLHDVRIERHLSALGERPEGLHQSGHFLPNGAGCGASRGGRA